MHVHMVSYALPYICCTFFPTGRIVIAAMKEEMERLSRPSAAQRSSSPFDAPITKGRPATQLPCWDNECMFVSGHLIVSDTHNSLRHGCQLSQMSNKCHDSLWRFDKSTYIHTLPVNYVRMFAVGDNLTSLSGVLRVRVL